MGTQFRVTVFLAILAISGVAPSAPVAHADPATRKAALSIATAGLSQNIASLGDKNLVVAGGHQFHDLWIRDFAMSVGGLLAIAREDAVRDTLDLILSLQREDGLLPRVIDNHDITGRTILGSAFGVVQEFAEPLKGWFETENKVPVIDGNAAVPWAASRYVLQTRDIETGRRWLPAIERSLTWLESHYGAADGLIGNQPPYADWEDSVARQGKVAFTNELYLLALQGVADTAALVGREGTANDYRVRAIRAHAAFMHYFWDSEHHRILNFEGDDHLTADANFMAVAHGLVSQEVARDLLSHWPDQLGQSLPRTTSPDYADSLKDTIVKVVGIADYHDKLYWLWLGATAAMAERKQGHCDFYDHILDTIAATVAADQAVYEVYELNGTKLRHVNRLLYSAEQPFTWSSAMLVEAESGGCGSNR